jgi:hypothetical protein
LKVKNNRFNGVNDFLDYFHNNYNSDGENNIFSEKSHLWNRIFEPRTSTDSIDETILQNFLDPRTSLSSGTGDWERNLNSTLIKYFLDRIPNSLLSNDIKMPQIGKPITFTINNEGKELSTPYAWNLMTFGNFMRMYKPYLDTNKKIDIVEIGAGYGCAALLWMDTDLVNSYTIIDLKENLINSAYYLGENTKWENINFIEDSCQELETNSINFLTPGNIKHLDTVSFDLAINSDSLGEMPAATAQAYVKWIYSKLNQGGYFLSKNGHRRSMDGLQKFSEYGYDQFNLVELSPPYSSSSGFDDFSHLILLKKDLEKIDSEKMKYLDTLSNLFAIGLSEDLTDICNNLKNDCLIEDDRVFLEIAESFFRDGNIIKDYCLDLDADNKHEYIIHYLISVKESILKKTKNIKPGFEKFLNKGKSDIARFYSYMFLIYYGKLSIQSNDIKRENFPGVDLFMEELDGFKKENVILKKVKYLIRIDNVRKKLFPYKKFNPSLVVKLKNLYINLSKRRGFSFFR